MGQRRIHDGSGSPWEYPAAHLRPYRPLRFLAPSASQSKWITLPAQVSRTGNVTLGDINYGVARRLRRHSNRHDPTPIRRPNRKGERERSGTLIVAIGFSCERRETGRKARAERHERGAVFVCAATAESRPMNHWWPPGMPPEWFQVGIAQETRGLPARRPAREPHVATMAFLFDEQRPKVLRGMEVGGYVMQNRSAQQGAAAPTGTQPAEMRAARRGCTGTG